MWVLSHRRKKMRTLCILERLGLRESSTRCELRYVDIEPAPKPSSSSKILKYLSSHVLLFLDSLWSLCRIVFSSLSHLCFFISSYLCLTRVTMAPWNKSEDDERECVFDDDYYKKMSMRMMREKKSVRE